LDDEGGIEGSSWEKHPLLCGWHSGGQEEKENCLSDLVETFASMHEAKLKMNSEKCVFGITRGKVLRWLVSMKGIEANPNKIRAIIKMQPP
jgi:hypothetical protein